jgi:leader peptidase (prepilin peptidase)/N-methyltransferase
VNETPFLFPIVVILGLLVGSYLNVVIYRLPRGKSTVTPRSSCPHCGSLIPWWANIPVASFIALRGRCFECQSPIRWRYPLVELTTAVLFGACFLLFGPHWSWLLATAFACLLLVLSMIDLDLLILPDRLTLPGALIVLAVSPWLPWSVGLPWHLLGSLVGAFMLLALYGFWYLLRRTEGLGLGDVKLMALIGAGLGWPHVLVALFLGALSASAVALALLIRGRLRFGNKMAFGPFLALGAVLTMLALGAPALRSFLPWLGR